ncbi:nicotinate-nucleotide adenylyltransferase [Bacillus aquiflavi]|uniref:Probable nicotinate-nucleotide adenylyltransferase n=1 Tax=Bacillus aquiflavi TaxID=2672567 RepID=A0A6B3VSS8_9BACI|nr:nicotinate-nucleotide adenylyltransferase [Bacillus aquiflavi]MBA4535903.1 nicotinate-nucleotide adenylyltransferase [Bacillus aquiflavi]NEY80278.1 nicotinate-nucleotide adenylyltransferase [Bacillus aquiflavi]UAC47320.1 nicotinate-nucleotide adenylyltransferase [Bacillus aquiflavi]
MKKIGIFGGTFDPPHYGHLLIANEVLCSLQLDEIWFMPNQDPPHKEKSANVCNEDRVNMLQLCIKDHPKFRVETIELKRPGRSYTYDTMKMLTTLYPNHQFYFIIGADMIEYLPKWQQIDQLVQLVQFVGVKRPTFKHETTYPVVYVDIPEIGFSSSMIRERLKTGRSVRYLLHDSVRLYIKENHLYGS